MRTLYNHYQAALGNDVQVITEIMEKAVNDVIAHCKANDISFRDAENVSHSTLFTSFAYQTLKYATEMKKMERQLRDIMNGKEV